MSAQPPPFPPDPQGPAPGGESTPAPEGTGYGQNAYGQNAYGQNAYGQNAYGQNAYGQDPYGQSPYAPRPQTYGYVPPPGQAAPPGWLTSDERTWAMLSHLSLLVISIIGPVIIMLTKGKESPYIRDQAVESLNFQISILIYLFAGILISIPLFFVIIGIFTMFAAMAIPVVGTVYAIIAGVKANQGVAFRYPLTIRMVS